MPGGLQPSVRSTRTKLGPRPASRREGPSHVGTAGLESPAWTKDDGRNPSTLGTRAGSHRSSMVRAGAAGSASVAGKFSDETTRAACRWRPFSSEHSVLITTAKLHGAAQKWTGWWDTRSMRVLSSLTDCIVVPLVIRPASRDCASTWTSGAV